MNVLIEDVVFVNFVNASLRIRWTINTTVNKWTRLSLFYWSVITTFNILKMFLKEKKTIFYHICEDRCNNSIIVFIETFDSNKENKHSSKKLRFENAFNNVLQISKICLGYSNIHRTILSQYHTIIFLLDTSISTIKSTEIDLQCKILKYLSVLTFL